MFWINVLSFLDDVVTKVEDTAERMRYAPLETIQDMVEEKQREREIARLEREFERDDQPAESSGGILKEIYDIFTETGDAFKEIFTIGAYEMLVKGNSEWRPSSDIMDDAREVIENANALYNASYQETKKSVDGIEAFIEEVKYKKVLLAERFNKIILENNVDIKLSKNYVVEPNLRKVHTPALNIAPIVYSNIPKISMTKNLGFALMPINVLNTAISGNTRIKIATENLEDAKDFMIKVKSNVARMQEIMVRVKEVENVLIEENTILKTLLATDVGYDMVNTYNEKLRLLLAETIVDDDGVLNLKYQSAVETLKQTVERFGF